MKNKIAFLGILVILSLGTPAISSNPSIDDLKIEADEIFYSKASPYQPAEFNTIFKSVLEEVPLKMLENVYNLWENKPKLKYYTAPQEIEALQTLWVNAKMLLSSDDPADDQEGAIYQFIAAAALPYKTKTYEFDDIIKKFEPILQAESMEFFRKGMDILLNKSPRKPKHEGNQLIDTYRCLLGKCIYALGQQNPNGLQKDAIEQLYAFATHKKIIATYDGEFAKSITADVCKGCQRRALGSLPLPFKF